ncbi:hypothetical protein LMG28727_06543 [Paraburkholderia kirstenboschensis]|nr:hypothetical protein LMG28727_06543 [Paraburkholderia kirstenboschensis]
MRRRKPGQGFEVPSLSLGCMGFGRSRDILDLTQLAATGKIDTHTIFGANDFRALIPPFTREAREINRPPVDLRRIVAARHDATPTQVALVRQLPPKPWIVTIRRARKPLCS